MTVSYTHLDVYKRQGVGNSISLHNCRNCIIHTSGEKQVVVEGLDSYIIAERNGALDVYKRQVIGIPVNHFLINGTLTEEYLNNGLHFKNTPKVKGYGTFIIMLLKNMEWYLRKSCQKQPIPTIPLK